MINYSNVILDKLVGRLVKLETDIEGQKMEMRTRLILRYSNFLFIFERF